MTNLTPEQKRMKIAKVIAGRLFTISHGTKDAETGRRLAVMKGERPHEIELGGWCRSAAEREIVAVLLEKGIL